MWDEWSIGGVITRLIVCLFCIYLTIFFRKKYVVTKTEGMPNHYFHGLMWFFGMIALVMFGLFLTDYLNSAEIANFEVKGQFEGYGPEMKEKFGLLSILLYNLMSPGYLMLSQVALLVFAAQMLPLEEMLNPKKPIFKTILIAVGLMCLIYIPGLALTIFAFIILLFGYLSLILAFFVNFIMTGMIIKRSTGIVRKRAFMNISGFFVFLIGMIWSMRVGWSEMIWSGFTNFDVDVVFGNIVMLISAIVYYFAFKSEKIE